MLTVGDSVFELRSIPVATKKETMVDQEGNEWHRIVAEQHFRHKIVQWNVIGVSLCTLIGITDTLALDYLKGGTVYHLLNDELGHRRVSHEELYRWLDSGSYWFISVDAAKKTINNL